MFKGYPKMIYPVDGSPVVVQSAEEAAAILGPNIDPNRLPSDPPPAKSAKPEAPEPVKAVEPKEAVRPEPIKKLIRKKE